MTHQDWMDIIKSIKTEKRFITHTYHGFQAMDQNGSGEVTLDEAAECLAKKDATPAEVKTKARRLYDIANICCTLELVEKYRLPGTSYRKPVYRWTGFQRYPFPLPKNTKIQVPCPVDLFEAAGILNEVPSHLYTEYYQRQNNRNGKLDTHNRKCHCFRNVENLIKGERPRREVPRTGLAQQEKK